LREWCSPYEGYEDEQKHMEIIWRQWSACTHISFLVYPGKRGR
jgi:hypothetical protein